MSKYTKEILITIMVSAGLFLWQKNYERIERQSDTVTQICSYLETKNNQEVCTNWP